jgi:hypothetical protein
MGDHGRGRLLAKGRVNHECEDSLLKDGVNFLSEGELSCGEDRDQKGMDECDDGLPSQPAFAAADQLEEVYHHLFKPILSEGVKGAQSLQPFGINFVLGFM